ncbi:caspase family protein [Nocardia sp. CA-084685]|uniref:caspase family protein n=1 Tax=Nocardia sp. CA-084685 TaxID=3239970 RepID=UPI003D9708DB
MRFPDRLQSRAVLIGVGRHDASSLPPIPAVPRNLADLRAALIDPVGGTLSAENCWSLGDPVAATDIGDVVAHAAAQATDVLLVYYCGHGLVDDRGRLHLALQSTDPARPRWTALPFDTLREEIVSSPAAARVLLLDCCFSGRAIEAMTDSLGIVAGQVDIAGTYTITSTTANSVSYAPTADPHTCFTGALLAVCTSSKEALTLDELYDQVNRRLRAQGLPGPQRRAFNATGNMALFKGPAQRPSPVRQPALRTPWSVQQDDLTSSPIRQGHQTSSPRKAPWWPALLPLPVIATVWITLSVIDQIDNHGHSVATSAAVPPAVTGSAPASTPPRFAASPSSPPTVDKSVLVRVVTDIQSNIDTTLAADRATTYTAQLKSGGWTIVEFGVTRLETDRPTVYFNDSSPKGPVAAIAIASELGITAPLVKSTAPFGIPLADVVVVAHVCGLVLTTC